MTKIGILHHDFLCPGGGERLSISLAAALERAGYNVVLGTVSKTDWVRMYDLFRYSNPFSDEVYLFERPFAHFSIYKHLLTSRVVRKLRKKGCEIVINTHGDPIGEPCEITYMHYPVRGLLNQKYTGLYGLYFRGYKYLQGREGFERRYLDRTKIITNSKFTQGEIRRILRRDAEVVYPPAVSANLTDPKFPRRDQVLTVSRIALDKDLGILKDIASMNAAFRYYLVGTTDKTSPQVIKDLQGIIIFPNLGYSDLKELYSTSKVYLHTKHNEHFGISIVEAMSYGCVPVVHRSGGPWIDILDQKQGEYGYAYETAEEAYRYIEFLMVDRVAREEIARRARERALSLFSEETFQRRMVEIVESVLSRVTVVQ